MWYVSFCMGVGGNLLCVYSRLRNEPSALYQQSLLCCIMRKILQNWINLRLEASESSNNFTHFFEDRLVCDEFHLSLLYIIVWLEIGGFVHYLFAYFVAAPPPCLTFGCVCTEMLSWLLPNCFVARLISLFTLPQCKSECVHHWLFRVSQWLATCSGCNPPDTFTTSVQRTLFQMSYCSFRCSLASVSLAAILIR